MRANSCSNFFLLFVLQKARVVHKRKAKQRVRSSLVVKKRGDKFIGKN